MKLALENTEICEYACVVYESCATLSPDGYLILWHIATYKKWLIFPCKESLVLHNVFVTDPCLVLPNVNTPSVPKKEPFKCLFFIDVATLVVIPCNANFLVVAFVFNWVGLLASLCINHTVAGRFGAISGFGLSMVKWVLIVKVEIM